MLLPQRYLGFRLVIQPALLCKKAHQDRWFQSDDSPLLDEVPAPMQPPQTAVAPVPTSAHPSAAKLHNYFTSVRKWC
jgi:hypothetical protein